MDIKQKLQKLYEAAGLANLPREAHATITQYTKDIMEEIEKLAEPKVSPSPEDTKEKKK